MEPTRKLIPFNTDIDKEQYVVLLGAIKWREKLARSRDIEEGLWYLDQVLHLRRLRDHNDQKFGYGKILKQELKEEKARKRKKDLSKL